MDKWDNRFLNITFDVATWSSCVRHNVGCVIVRDKRIIATGYNGAPSGIETCKDRGFCYKNSLGINNGPLNCFAVHAEQNALMQAAKLGISCEGATVYCTTQPCNICTKLLINAGISKVVYVEEYKDEFRDKMLENLEPDRQIKFIQYEGFKREQGITY